ncbi:MAG: hypothetical protein GX945_02455 [Lentisphaerae bacterium]|nr:hypothetical protein [Lentisphaerota bacterium]
MSTTIIPATRHLARRCFAVLPTLLLCAALPAQTTAPTAIPSTVCEQFGIQAADVPALLTVTEAAPCGRALPDFTRVQVAAVAKNRLLFNISFAQKPDFQCTSLIVYLDLDNNRDTGRKDKHHPGVDLMVIIGNNTAGTTVHNNAVSNPLLVATLEDSELWLLLEAPLHSVDGKTIFGLHLLAENKRSATGVLSKSSPHQIAGIAASDREPDKNRALGRSSSLVPLSYYGYYNDKIALLPLENKGLRAEQVRSNKVIQPERPRPELSLPAESGVTRPARDNRQEVAFELLEEAGVARKAARVRFGLPLPQGRLFQTAQLRLIAPDGSEAPAQFAVMGLWPDQSLKWVLVQFNAPIAANERQLWRLEYGHAVRAHAQRPTQLLLKNTPENAVISNGLIQIVVNKERFGVAMSETGSPAGIRQLDVILRDEAGQPFLASGAVCDDWRIEEQGPERIVIRMAGRYGDNRGRGLMSYVARLSCQRQSPIVELSWTHINSEIEIELTDITSLYLSATHATPMNSVAAAFQDSAGQLQKAMVAELPAQGHATIFQLDDRRAQCSAPFAATPGDDKTVQRLDGAVSTSGVQGGLGIAVQNFWQRWPKAVSAGSNELLIGLLPTQPSKSYGQDLPYYLLYPFLEGKYRSKWGMAFTEKILFDVTGDLSRRELSAEADWPLIAVLPAEWYDNCRVFDDIAVPQGEQLSLWDEWFAKRYEGNMRRRERQREYGYFNFGDSFGERGRNWTNNEYDFALGQFLQFLRSGERRYYRLGMEAARHQADVDLVHAYPDPFYIGSNHQHSIGHTGQWSQNPVRATWTHRYDSHTDARNGHTWLEGMVTAWCLAGEPRPMEASYALGEHILWAMAPDFKALGTHERSAGWSLKAAMSLYKHTGDQLYLDAAKKIFEVAYKEQKFDQGGAWPHVLPSDHAGKEPGAVGNCLFLMGTIVSGIKDYHEVTRDERAARSIVSAVGWIMLSYDRDVRGWPYTAKLDGTPLWRPAPGGSPMLPQVVAYAGLISKNRDMIQAAKDCIEAMLLRNQGNSGKGIAAATQLNANALAILQRWYAENAPAEAATLLSGNLADAWRKNIANAKEFRLRAPNQKQFVLRLSGDSATVQVRRSSHGSMPKRAEFATLRLSDTKGKVIAEERCSTDDEKTFALPIKGRPGDLFWLDIDDDQRAVWDARGDGLLVVGKLAPGSSIGGVRTSRYFFLPPVGTRSFRIKLTGVHNGNYACVVVDNAGNECAQFEGEYYGDAQIVTLGGVKRSHELSVDVGNAVCGVPWALLLTAAGDIGIELIDVPPYLATSPEQLFLPDERN